MPKINKVAKELNVGIKTAVEFLAKNGIQVSADPNARIDDAAVTLLNKEFSTDQRFKAETDKYTSNRRGDKKASKTERTEAPEEMPAPRGPKILGKIDLSNPGRPVVKPVGDAVVKNEKSGSERQGRSGDGSRRDRDRNRSGRRDDSQRRSERGGSQQQSQQQQSKPAQQAPKPVQQPKPQQQAPKPAPAPAKPEVKQETPAAAPAPAETQSINSNVFRLNTPSA
ncbi:MAG: hypothetical protein K2N96_11425, partial [Muribaculaceae bacterium]|nr:hypothetical protein [Muribaculaceae bacterium]